MEKTVVAVFDTQSEAQEALAALVNKGFASGKARVASSESLRGMTDSADSRVDSDESFGQKMARWFGFGDQDDIYGEAVRRGGYVLTFDAASDDEAERASDIIEKFDPVDIDERTAQWRDSGWQATPRTGGDSAIPIVEEQLHVGKREIQRGGIRVMSRVVERPVEEDVTLREEHATVSRRPVDRAATGAETAFKEQSFEVRGTAEEAVVGKSARVVEEVVVGKESSTREETVRGNVRRTEVDVEKLGPGAAGTSKMSRYHGPERRHNPSASYRGMERRA